MRRQNRNIVNGALIVGGATVLVDILLQWIDVYASLTENLLNCMDFISKKWNKKVRWTLQTQTTTFTIKKPTC